VGSGEFGVERGLHHRPDPPRVLGVEQADRAAQQRHPHRLAIGHQSVEFGRDEVLQPGVQAEERGPGVLRLHPHDPVQHLDGVVIDASQQMLTLQQCPIPLPQTDPIAHAGYFRPVDA